MQFMIIFQNKGGLRNSIFNFMSRAEYPQFIGWKLEMINERFFLFSTSQQYQNFNFGYQILMIKKPTQASQLAFEEQEDTREESNLFDGQCARDGKKNQNKMTWEIAGIILVILSLIGIGLWKKGDDVDLRVKQFDEFFASKATIIEATVPLKTEYSPVTWPELGTLKMVDLTVIIQSANRPENLKSTLSTFFKYNTYPLKKIVAINDGPMDEEFEKVVKQYPNITWIMTNMRVGQIAAIDQAYKHIDTEYYFHTEDDWDYLRPGFIQYCLQALEFDPKLNGLRLTHQTSFKQQCFIAGPLKIVTEIQLHWNSALSFNPSAHRLKQYQLFEGGYTGATFNLSYGKGAGNCQSFISIQYAMRNYHSALTPVEFIRHTGGDVATKKSQQDNSNNPNWTRVIDEYGRWEAQNYNREKQKEGLNYLIQKQKQLGLPPAPAAGMSQTSEHPADVQVPSGNSPTLNPKHTLDSTIPP